MKLIFTHLFIYLCKLEDENESLKRQLNERNIFVVQDEGPAGHQQRKSLIKVSWSFAYRSSIFLHILLTMIRFVICCCCCWLYVA